MRVFAYLLLPVAVVSVGFGLWLFYARYVGGPEYYLGSPDPVPLRKGEASLANLQAIGAETDARLAGLRAKVETLPEGDVVRTKLEAELGQLDQRAAKRGEMLVKQEAAVERLRQADESLTAAARTRTARRGWLFTLIGLLTTVRTVESIRSRRRS